MGSTLGRSPDLDQIKTPACRTLGTPPHQTQGTVPSTATTTPPAGAARTPARSPQSQGRLPRQAPYPTVYFLQCSTTAPPRFGEKTTTSTTSCACTPPLLVSIKGGDGLSFRGMAPSGRTQHPALLTEHIRSSEPRYWHSPQSTPPLAETWELPSLSRLACTPTTCTPGAR